MSKPRFWTKEEDAFLMRNYDKIGEHEIGIHCGNRSISAVRNRLRRLGLSNKQRVHKRWTAEEDAVLFKYAQTLTRSKLGKKLNRSSNSVDSRMKRLNIKPLCAQKRWSKDDLDYATAAFGSINLTRIAKKVGRSPSAVISQLENQGIYSGKKNSGLYSIYDMSYVLQVDDHTVRRMIKVHGLPTKKYSIRKQRYEMINPSDFWEWAEHNKDVINWTKVLPNSLPPEPEWVEDQRRIDLKTIPRKTGKPWTDEEEDRLFFLYHQQRMSTKEIGVSMDRSAVAIRARISKVSKKRMSISVD